MEVLQPEDEEPFILASVKRGQARMAIDTYMFKTGLSAYRNLGHAKSPLTHCSAAFSRLESERRL